MLKNKKYLIIIGIIVFLWITQFSSNFKSSELVITEIPQDFIFDGCSMFPDGGYGHCCRAHDEDYFFGGSWKQRMTSDMRLSSCVQELGGLHTILGPAMGLGVRVGGAPIWPTSYRWGFGRDIY